MLPMAIAPWMCVAAANTAARIVRELELTTPTATRRIQLERGHELMQAFLMEAESDGIEWEVLDFA